MTDVQLREFWQTKARHAQPSERRALEPICLSLIQRNNDRALVTIQTTLRKPSAYTAILRTLQAVTFQRLGRGVAALEELEYVRSTAKALEDSDIILFCCWIWEQHGRDAEGATLWEAATSKNPKKLDLGVEACFYYIRISDWKRMYALLSGSGPLLETIQQNKQASEAYGPLFAWGAGLAAILQQYAHSPSDRQSFSNAIAEAHAHYCDPIPNAIGGESEHVQWLRLRVQELALASLVATHGRGSPEAKSAIEEFMTTLMSDPVREAGRKSLKIDILRRDGIVMYGGKAERRVLWEEMHELLVEKGDTNLHTILTMNKCATGQRSKGNDHLVASVSEPVKGASDELVETAAEEADPELLSKTLSTLSELSLRDPRTTKPSATDSEKIDRGYLQGYLSLLATLRTTASVMAQLPSEDQEKHSLTAELVKRYYDFWGSKPACFDDLAWLYPQLKEESEREKLRQLFREDGHASTEDIDVSSLAQVQRSINVVKLMRALQPAQSSQEQNTTNAERYAKAYFASLHYGKDLPATELQPADDFALLAAQAYLGTGRTIDTSRLEIAAALLEFAIRRSKYRYQIRVLLIRLYRLLGAPSLALHHYRLLDARQIQNDSISHFAFERASTFSFNEQPEKPKPSTATTLGEPAGNKAYAASVQDIVRWYPQVDQEVTASTIKAFQSNAYNVIEGYVELQRKINYSLSRDSITLERWRTQIAKESLGDLDIQTLQVWLKNVLQAAEPLSDNRDYSILPNHQPLFPNDASPIDIEKQTAMGSRTDNPWLKAMCSIYAAFILPNHLPRLDTLVVAALSEQERRLYKWAMPLSFWLNGDPATIESGQVTGLFKELQANIASYDLSQPFWLVFHIAQIALEAYSLVDTAFQLRSVSAGDFKGIKQLKQARQDAKGGLKPIVAKLKALVEDMNKKYKGKNKLEPLLELKQYEAIDDDYLMDFATQLVDSKKTALAQLIQTIAKRTAGQ